MKYCTVVILSLLFACTKGEPQDPIQGLCEAYRLETANMIWVNGCAHGLYSLFPEHKKPHTFGLSDHCKELFLKLRNGD